MSGVQGPPAQGGGGVAGANTQVQFNNSGVFAGSSDFLWVNSSQTLRLLTTGVELARFGSAGIELGSGISVSFVVRGITNFYQHTHINAPNGALYFSDTSRAVNNQEWGMDYVGGDLALHTNSDNGGATANNALLFLRSGLVVSSVLFGNATNNPTYQFLGTGLTTFSGSIARTKVSADQSYSLQTPTTGFSITIADIVGTLILNPAGTLATGTVTMPANPINGQEIRVSSSQIITTLTVAANAGQTISNAPTTVTAGGGFSYIYNLSGTRWFRLY